MKLFHPKHTRRGSGPWCANISMTTKTREKGDRAIGAEERERGWGGDQRL